MLPGVGDLVAAEDLRTAAQGNDWAGIGMGLLAAIPGIPALGGAARGAKRQARRGLLEPAAQPAPRSGLLAGGTEADEALARYRAVNPQDTGARVLNPGDEGYPTNAQWDEASQAYVAPRSVDDLVARAAAMGARLDISQGRNGLTLSRIEVPPSARSQGVGSRVMREVESYADSAGLPVGLTPSGDFGGSVPRLNEFYRRFGFTPNSGRSRDFSTRETMLRQPREIAPVEPDYPIRAFHGSPHSFDRFSLDKIGTGEGAQAYGHGLYFAESEDVARAYRDTLAGDGYLRADGSVWNPQTLQHMNVRVAANRNGADLEATIARARDVLQRAVESSPPETVAMARADLADLESLRDAGGVRPNPGSMYEVGINAHPDTFLDWDRPLSEQPAGVRDAINRVGRDVEPYGLDRIADDMRGIDMSRMLGNPAATDRLAQEGVSGIRYLDGNSRGVGEGSSNYVVFNDELVKILRKYGISGLGLGGGAGLGAGLLSNQQETPASTGL
jgi:GNAT superfamily N-acetyltransferase